MPRARRATSPTRSTEESGAYRATAKEKQGYGLEFEHSVECQASRDYAIRAPSGLEDIPVMRTLLNIFTALMFAGLAAAPPGAPADTSQDLARARRIHAEAIGVDSHIDTLQRALNGGEDISKRTAGGHVDLPRLRESGMRAPFFALYVPTYYKGSEAVRRTLQVRDAMQSLLDAHPEAIELATTASDVERITRAGKISALLTIESGHAIADDLAVLRM